MLRIMKCLDELCGVRATSVPTSAYRSGLSLTRKLQNRALIWNSSCFHSEKHHFNRKSDFTEVKRKWPSKPVYNPFKLINDESSHTLIDFLHACRLWPLKLRSYQLSISPDTQISFISTTCRVSAVLFYLLFRFLFFLDGGAINACVSNAEVFGTGTLFQVPEGNLKWFLYV